MRAARAKRFVFLIQGNAPQEKGEWKRKMAETILRMTGIQKYFPAPGIKEVARVFKP